MNLLLDTHVLIWSVMDTGSLSTTARTVILDTDNSIFASVASFLEISLKYSTGRLRLNGILPDDFPEVAGDMGFSILELSPEIVSTFYKLPKTNNKDPFDRLIAWQTLKSGMTLLSCDKAFDEYASYDLKRIW